MWCRSEVSTVLPLALKNILFWNRTPNAAVRQMAEYSQNSTDILLYSQQFTTIGGVMSRKDLPQRPLGRMSKVLLGVAGFGSLVCIIFEAIAITELDTHLGLAWTALAFHIVGCAVAYVGAIPKNATQRFYDVAWTAMIAALASFAIGTALLALSLHFVTT